MPPASNQLFTFNDVAAEVAAGRMVWSGSAQSGNQPLTWSQYTGAVMTDGTNPAGYASNECPTYSDALARAIVLVAPTNVVISSNLDGTVHLTWTEPTTGLTPTGYKVQFVKNGVNLGALQTIAHGSGTTDSTTGYATGNSAYARIYSYNGSNVSNTVQSNVITY